jgi:hypothetical protein
MTDEKIFAGGIIFAFELHCKRIVPPPAHASGIFLWCIPRHEFTVSSYFDRLGVELAGRHQSRAPQKLSVFGYSARGATDAVTDFD